MDPNDRAVLSYLFPDYPIAIRPITGRGEVNRVYYVSSDEHEWIVRLNGVAEGERFSKEAWCIDQARSLCIPSPQVLAIGTVHDVSYMTLTYVSGVQGHAIDDPAAVWSTIGTYAKRIHGIPTTGFGDRMTTPGDFGFSWEQYVGDNIASLTDNEWLGRLGVVTNDQAAALQRRFTALLDRPFRFGLIHGDLSLMNVLVNRKEVHLIDWGCSEANVVPHHEFIALEQNNVAPGSDHFTCFLRGYGMSSEEYWDIRPDIETLTVLQALEKLRWALDRKPERVEAFAHRVKLLVGRSY